MISTQSESGERTRLACWQSRLRDCELLRPARPVREWRKKISARAPKATREGACAPQKERNRVKQ